MLQGQNDKGGSIHYCIGGNQAKKKCRSLKCPNRQYELCLDLKCPCIKKHNLFKGCYTEFISNLNDDDKDQSFNQLLQPKLFDNIDLANISTYSFQQSKEETQNKQFQSKSQEKTTNTDQLNSLDKPKMQKKNDAVDLFNQNSLQLQKDQCIKLDNQNQKSSMQSFNSSIGQEQYTTNKKQDQLQKLSYFKNSITIFESHQLIKENFNNKIRAPEQQQSISFDENSGQFQNPQQQQKIEFFKINFLKTQVFTKICELLQKAINDLNQQVNNLKNQKQWIKKMQKNCQMETFRGIFIHQFKASFNNETVQQFKNLQQKTNTFIQTISEIIKQIEDNDIDKSQEYKTLKNSSVRSLSIYDDKSWDLSRISKQKQYPCTDIMKGLLKHSQSQILQGAILALQNISTRQKIHVQTVLELIKYLLKNQDESIRKISIGVLYELSKKQVVKSSTVVELLKPLEKDKDSTVRKNAKQTIDKINQKQGIRVEKISQQLIHLQKDDNYSIRRSAKQASKKISQPQGIKNQTVTIATSKRRKYSQSALPKISQRQEISTI